MKSPIRELALWEFAGLFVTYWCNARCAFCYLYSGPQGGGWMSPQQAVRYWQGLARLAERDGKTVRIHLSGGEPFGDWNNLLAIATAAHRAGLTANRAFEKVETNAYWADSEQMVSDRLGQLDACGMQMLVVSADVFHQQFVSFERVRRCVEVARQVLGEERVRVRWWDFYRNPIDTARLSPPERHAAIRAALTRHRDRLTGRAADELPVYLDCRPAEAFADQHCTRPILRSRHVHIDPVGWVFPGVCTGIVLGNADRLPIDELWTRLAKSWPQDAVLSDLVEGGPYRLYQRACQMGYQPRPGGYAGKCHLCTHIRQFLFEGGHFPERLGPADCYRPAEEKPAPAGPAGGLSLPMA